MFSDNLSGGFCSSPIHAAKQRFDRIHQQTYSILETKSQRNVLLENNDVGVNNNAAKWKEFCLLELLFICFGEGDEQHHVTTQH